MLGSWVRAPDGSLENQNEAFHSGGFFRIYTFNEYTIMLLPQAYNILLKYDFDLNLMTNQKCNEYLKIIAQQADIHTNLTFHMARHTFATWALSNGVDVATVKDMLAHSSIEMTINDAKVLDKQVVNDFQMLKRKSININNINPI